MSRRLRVLVIVLLLVVAATIGLYAAVSRVAPTLLTRLISSLGLPNGAIRGVSLIPGGMQIEHAEFGWGNAPSTNRCIADDLTFLFSLGDLASKELSSVTIKRLAVDMSQTEETKKGATPSRNFYDTLSKISFPFRRGEVNDFTYTLERPNNGAARITGALKYAEPELLLHDGSFTFSSDPAASVSEIRGHVSSDLTLSRTSDRFLVNPIRMTFAPMTLWSLITVGAGELSFSDFSITPQEMHTLIAASADLTMPRYETLSPGSFYGAGSVTMSPHEMEVSVKEATLKLLGGQFSVSPFSYSTGSTHESFVVTLKGMRLEDLFGIYPDSKISGAGVLDGTLPIEIDRSGVRIVHGTIQSKPPGGVLRGDLSQWSSAHPDNQGIVFATQALGNFHYTSLSAAVEYDVSGILNLSVVLDGTNPDVSKDQPIHLNVNIQENIPSLIKTMQLITEGPKNLSS